MTQPVLGIQNLSSYFYEEIKLARKDVHVEISEFAEYYLVNLLCEFSRTPVFLESNSPLVLLLAEAQEGTFVERSQKLKQLGDVALYKCGYFSESITRRNLDVEYMIRLGGHAYRELSVLVAEESGGARFSTLYQELADRFFHCVTVLQEVALRAHDCVSGNKEVVRLYEHWCRTKSMRSQRQLLALGFFVKAGTPRDKIDVS